MKTGIIEFQGKEIETIKTKKGGIWVSVKRICENIGITSNAQVTKLNNREDLCCNVIVVPDKKGVKQRMFCIELKSLAGWLYTLNPQKVRPAIKESLIFYQKETTNVIQEYWFGSGVVVNKRRKPVELLKAIGKEINKLQSQNETFHKLKKVYRGKISELEQSIIQRENVVNALTYVLKTKNKELKHEVNVSAEMVETLSESLGTTIEKYQDARFDVLQCEKANDKLVQEVWELTQEVRNSRQLTDSLRKQLKETYPTFMELVDGNKGMSKIELKKQYLKAVKAYHPDMFNAYGSYIVKYATEIMQILNAGKYHFEEGENND